MGLEHGVWLGVTDSGLEGLVPVEAGVQILGFEVFRSAWSTALNLSCEGGAKHYLKTARHTYAKGIP